MKAACSIFFLLGLFVVHDARYSVSISHAVAPRVGLEIGQQAPAFALLDQFGREQSNETLKGSKGTVILFFRSADW